MTDRRLKFLLLISVFAIATCGLIYELIAGTLASYLLGDSVTQFSTIIGAYLFAMGIGSYFSKFIERNEVALFVQVELLIGLVGGSSAAILFMLFSEIDSFRVLLYAIVTVIGVLVGLEIPLLLRILNKRVEFKDLVSQVFTFDYVGALLASLLFPLVLVPHLGLVRSSFLFGALNVLVALLTLWLLRRDVVWARSLQTAGLIILAGLITGFGFSDRLLAWSEKSAYVDTVIFARSTPYQRIVLTREANDLRLYLNGNLQFSSRDEYRYHEALVHPGLARLNAPADILVLGGGDGIAVREVLKYPSIQHVTLVDLDPEMTHLFSTQELLLQVNHSALLSPKVHVINADAFIWLQKNTNQFDFIIADFPDPSNFSLGKLFTTAFYNRVRSALRPHGGMVVQCTSPWVARKSYWCIDETLHASGFVTEPYHLYVPSFGEWGFILASLEPLPESLHLPADVKYVNAASVADMYHFPPDMGPLKVEPNRLNNQMLVRYFEEEWAHYVH
jgi:spermidine synthase